MRGYPKLINTKRDFENVMAVFPKEKWLPDLQALLDEEFAWFTTGTLKDSETGLTDDTHRVKESEERDGTKTRTQEEYKPNPRCRMYRMGFTHEQVEKLITENS